MSYGETGILEADPVDHYMDAGASSYVPEKHARAEAKDRRRRKRRMQLAAALIEADNDEIQQRIDFLTNMDPGSKDMLNNISLLPKYANQSVMFHDALVASDSHMSSRPVYVHAPQSMRALTQSYLGMGGQYLGDDPEELQILDESTAPLEPVSVESVAQNLLQLSLSPHELGSPMEDTWNRVETRLKQRPSLRSTSSMPMLTEATKKKDALEDEDISMDTTQMSAKDLTRSALLLERIRKSRIVSDPQTVDADISDSSDTSCLDTQHDTSLPRPGASEHMSTTSEEPMQPPQGEGHHPDEPVSGPSSDLLGFRARVLKPRTERRRSSRRHSLAVFEWPEESSALEHEALMAAEADVQAHHQMTTGQLQRLVHGTAEADQGIAQQAFEADSQPIRSLAPLLARRETTRHRDMTSSTWTKRKNGLRAFLPFDRHKILRKSEEQEKPMIVLEPPPAAAEEETPRWRSMLTEPSPTTDQTNTEAFKAPQSYHDEDLMGVSLQTPVVEQQSAQEPSASDPAQVSMEMSSDPAHDSAFEQEVSRPEARFKGISYICIPPPLEHMPREYPSSSFFVPHGAFYVDDRGVVLPRNKTFNESHYELDFGPVQVPEGIGRRVLYPTTALFRNVLVRRDEDREGWGFERFSCAPAYFNALYADDDDSDDEVPLMDVRIQTKEEQLARRRIHREHVRRRRARMERRRLRELAKRQGKRASVFGIEEESSGNSTEALSTDWSEFSSDETDPELPWKDDRRPAGRLYGKSLVGLAAEHQEQKQSKVRFYGQSNLNQRHSAPPESLGFYDDTRQRMAKLFGPQPRWMNDMEQREAKEMQSQMDTLKVGGTPLLGAQETTDLLMEPGVQEGIIYPSVQDAQEAEARAAEAADEAAISAWQDTSSDEEPQVKSQPVRFRPEKPRWEAPAEDDVPLSHLRRRSTAADADSLAGESEDEQPLGSRHRQAAIIAENQALIKQLMEENRQVRLSLQMLTSMPYSMPWMPQLPGQFAPMPHFDEDAPLLDDVVHDEGLAPPSEAPPFLGPSTPYADGTAPTEPMRDSMLANAAHDYPGVDTFAYAGVPANTYDLHASSGPAWHLPQEAGQEPQQAALVPTDARHRDVPSYEAEAEGRDHFHRSVPNGVQAHRGLESTVAHAPNKEVPYAPVQSDELGIHVPFPSYAGAAETTPEAWAVSPSQAGVVAWLADESQPGPEAPVATSDEGKGEHRPHGV